MSTNVSPSEFFRQVAIVVLADVAATGVEPADCKHRSIALLISAGQQTVNGFSDEVCDRYSAVGCGAPKSGGLDLRQLYLCSYHGISVST